MPLQPKLQKFTTVSPLLINFSYNDFASGTGIQIYFGIKVTNDPNELILTETALVGGTEITSIDHNTSVDLDLSPFNAVRTVKGTGYIELNGSAANGSSTITVKFQHWDGTTSTTLGTATATTFAGATAVPRSLKIPLTKKNFKVGDILRINVAATNTTSDTTTLYLSSDGSSPLKIHTPYEIK